MVGTQRTNDDMDVDDDVDIEMKLSELIGNNEIAMTRSSVTTERKKTEEKAMQSTMERYYLSYRKGRRKQGKAIAKKNVVKGRKKRMPKQRDIKYFFKDKGSSVREIDELCTMLVRLR